MGVNKIEFGGRTLIDISDSIVNPNTLCAGGVAYGANGDPVVGENPYEKTATDAELNIQAQLISQIAQALEGKAIEGGGTGEVALKDETFTENGTYQIPGGYDGYGEVTVAVPDEPPKLKLGQKFTSNGAYQIPSGYDGFGAVTVDVPTGTAETWTFTMENGSTVTKVVYVE